MLKLYINILILYYALMITYIDANKSRFPMEADMPNFHLQAMNTKESVQDNLRNELLKKGQLFRDIFSEKVSLHELLFGHVCENPNEWEQRFERKDMEKNSYQGKIKWGKKNGDYGEHYWDLNH